MKVQKNNRYGELILHYAIALLILILGITFVEITAQANQNLVSDPGFENNGIGWNNVAFGGRSITTAEFNSGNKSLQILVSNKYVRNVYQDIAVAGGSSYNASGWVKTSGVDGSGAFVRLLWLNATGNPPNIIHTDVIGIITGTQNWTQLSGTFTAPANAVVARLELYTSTDPDNSGTAWFDDTDFSTNASSQNDTTPPNCSITYPSDSQTVSGIITVSASAFDDIAVKYVELYKDNLSFANDTAAPYQYTWNTAGDSNSLHTLFAKAVDTSGNEVNSQVVSINVNNTFPQNRLNIVLILTDDQRWDTMQYMPLTKTLIGDEGVTFNNAFVSTPLCCPSRASILTGLYAHNHGVLGNSPPNGGAVSFNDTSTIATWLQSAGYRTGLYGKYLNNYINLTPWPYVPPGWSEWHAFKQKDITPYYNYYLVENGVEFYYNSNAANYSTTVLSNKAVNFIETTPQGQPFFLYFAPAPPHSPATPANQDKTLFGNLTPWRPPSYNETDVSDKPLLIRKLNPISNSTAQSQDTVRLNQLRSLQSVDRAVANIVDALNRTNQLNDTAIIFMSDNGYSLGEHRLFQKNCVYEECIRVPLLVRAPGISTHTDDNLILNIDLAPTFAEWAGISAPANVNGMSFASLLTDPLLPWRNEILLEVLCPKCKSEIRFNAVRTQQYIYAEYNNTDLEFYDLAADPYQMINSVNNTSYSQIISQLQGRLAVLKSA